MRAPRLAAGPGTTSPGPGSREAASAATDHNLENGLVGGEAPKTRGVEGLGGLVLKPGGKAEEVIIEEGAIFLEEADWEVQEQQVAEKLEVAEKDGGAGRTGTPKP